MKIKLNKKRNKRFMNYKTKFRKLKINNKLIIRNYLMIIKKSY